jgi:hypothetical protein
MRTQCHAHLMSRAEFRRAMARPNEMHLVERLTPPTYVSPVVRRNLANRDIKYTAWIGVAR